jgi:hypothetical protein
MHFNIAMQSSLHATQIKSYMYTFNLATQSPIPIMWSYNNSANHFSVCIA